MAAGSPVWIKPTSFEEAAAELGDALQMGAAGVWLDQRIFARPDRIADLEILRAQVHASDHKESVEHEETDRKKSRRTQLSPW
jgi:hypothetical protein